MSYKSTLVLSFSRIYFDDKQNVWSIAFFMWGFVWQSVMSKGLNIGEGEIRVRTTRKKSQVDGHDQGSILSKAGLQIPLFRIFYGFSCFLFRW